MVRLLIVTAHRQHPEREGFMDAEQSLLDFVFDRLAHDRVPNEVAALVLAAHTGTCELRSVLAGESLAPAAPEAKQSSPDPLYLAAITVAGFRGVGPSASLRLCPNPGLTLVVGRNGSGKSSFAEAAELALTGDSARWAEHNRVFREGWRNLHHGSPCAIEVLLRADGGSAPIRITRTWSDTADEPGQATSSAVADGKHYAGTGELGWAAPLQTYRPFLTADDLGRLISATPSGLFDALAPILGIEPITEADKRLMQARKEIDDRVKAVKASHEDLRTQLELVDDDRARRAVAILAKRQPDLDALDGLLAGTDEETADPVATACRRLAAVAVPELDHASRTADDLDDAALAVAAHAAQGALANQQFAGLLEQAIAYHHAHGDGPCPVCGTGVLNAGWQTRSTETLGRLRAETAAADRANHQLDHARGAAQALLGIGRLMMTGDIDVVAPGLGQEPERLRTALTAWQARIPQASPEQMAAHIRTAYPALHDAFAAVQAAAVQ